ncbi:Flp pilus assembly protein TadG [Candidatus Rhodobacter oscarellae]|uniref:Flp pilus assembly protein TadG n=1 Tax=Candidatus Rhodobacter oscarellae TaxID=1675527 RepID=A0A0J9E5N6_9RHOB|nr:Flp pilus assembly protein TadG [Candidatus Rhodobacter lobularis]
MLRKLRHWRTREDGNATIEFVIWFPFFMSIFGSAFEASFVSFRQVMLGGAVERTVRDLQLGHLGAPSHSELKTIICNTAGFIPDCANSLHIEMERVSTSDFAFRKGAVQCVDKDELAEPALNFANGTSNDLILMTVCAAVSPMVPITGLGLKLPKINGGTHYAVVAFSAFVVEPA